MANRGAPANKGKRQADYMTPEGIERSKATRFKTGQVPHNKGRKIEDYMSPDAIERTRATRFKEGGLPRNTREVGAERVSKDGYTYVHVRQHRRAKANDQWVPKHRLIWEREHGAVPDGHIIVFCDGDRSNLDPANLACISRRDAMAINSRGIAYYDRESLDVALGIVALDRRVHELRMGERECRRCGSTFAPRFPGQRTCDACLGRADD